jgi:hypothetical protein
MDTRYGLLISATLVLLAGCGGAPAPAEPAPGDRALLESAERPLQRAHQAEDTSDQRKADLDKKLEQAE